MTTYPQRRAAQRGPNWKADAQLLRDLTLQSRPSLSTREIGALLGVTCSSIQRAVNPQSLEKQRINQRKYLASLPPEVRTERNYRNKLRRVYGPAFRASTGAKLP